MKTPAQKLNAAIEAAECTACDLINAAECFALTGMTLWDIRCRRAALLEAARNYSAAVRRLARLKP